MASLAWALLCQRILIDQQTNLVSYIDALDGVALPRFPLAAPLVLVGTVWTREGEKTLEMRVVVYSPDGDRLMEAEAEPLHFAPQHKRGRMNLGVAGFEVAKPGSYTFAIETKVRGAWTEVHRVPLEIDEATEKSPTATPSRAGAAKRG